MRRSTAYTLGPDDNAESDCVITVRLVTVHTTHTNDTAINQVTLMRLIISSESDCPRP
jgi:hypothetical protein